MRRWRSNARHSCRAPRFYSLPVDLFLALLSGRHTIGAFVPCGLSTRLASFTGSCSRASARETTRIYRTDQRPALSVGKVALELYIGVAVAAPGSGVS